MTRVVISGYYGFANAGDEAMLAAIVGSLKDIIPDVSITVITGNCRMTRENHNVQAVHRLNFFAIAAAIRRCDILISGGGSLLQDVTSARSLYYYLWIMRIAPVLQEARHALRSGIGPVRGAKPPGCARCLAARRRHRRPRCRFQSRTGCHGRDPAAIHVTADAVLSMHPVDKNIGLYILKKHGITGIRRRLGIAVRNWQDHEAYKDAIAAAADELQETQDVHVIFIPMQYPADVEAGRDIASRMKTKAVVLDGHYTTVEFMSLMGCMDAVIANRLHALIFSAIMQVPATAVSYDPKIDSFIDLIGDRVCGTTEDVQAADIVADVSQKLALGHLAPEIKARLNHLRRQSLRNAYLALRILEGRKGVRKRLQQHRRSL